MEYATLTPPKHPPRGARALAGKALLAFLGLMAVLTLVSRTLHEMSLARVSTVSPQRGALERRVQADGTLSAAVEIPVVIPDEMRVVSVLVEPGAPVKEGDALLVLDYAPLVKEKTEAMEKALQDLQSKQQAYDWAFADVNGTTLNRLQERNEEYAQAEADFEEATLALADAQSDGDEATRSRAQRAYDRALEDLADARQRVDSFSRTRDYFTKREELSLAQKTHDAAKGDLETLLAQLDALLIGNGAFPPPYDPSRLYLRTFRAVASGVVQSIAARAGAVLSPDEPALLFSDLSGGLTLSLAVSAEQAADMRVGDPARVVIDGRVLELPISAIALSDQEDDGYTVRFDVPGEAGEPGMGASMVFQKRTQTYDTLIPLSALHSSLDGDFVYRVRRQDGALGTTYTLERVTVLLVEKDATRAAVQGGVGGGDLLVVRGDRALSAGDTVRLEETP